LVHLIRLLVRPFGYLAFVVALAALSATARLLGEQHQLGFFAGRLARMMWRYPAITRRGIQTAWLVWALLLVLALSPLDPLASQWDEVVLACLALLLLLYRRAEWRRDGY
jgi:hypothetical protein